MAQINSQETNQGQPTVELPDGIGGSVNQLSALFNIQPWALFQTLLAVVGATVGNAVKIRTPFLPGPLNLSLSCVVLLKDQCLLAQALDFLLQPLREFQDSQSLSLSTRGREILEKELGRLEATQAISIHCSDPEVPSPDNHLADLVSLRRSLRTFVLCEDAPPGRLAHAMQYSPDGAAVVVNHGAAVAGLLDPTDAGAASDRLLLRNGFVGRSFNSLRFEAKSAPPIIKPAIASFLIAEPQILAELFASEDSVLREFASQLICLQSSEASEATSHGVINSSPSVDPFKRLGIVLSELLRLRSSGQELILDLSPDAARSLVDFYHQQASRTGLATGCRQGFRQNPHLVGTKFAGNFQLLTPEPTAPITAAVIEKSIRMATTLSTETASLAELLVRQREEAEIERTADKMFHFLCETGKTERWSVWMKFDDHRKEKMLPALERLVRTGRTRIHPDGDIEAIRASHA